MTLSWKCGRARERDSLSIQSANPSASWEPLTLPHLPSNQGRQRRLDPDSLDSDLDGPNAECQTHTESLWGDQTIDVGDVAYWAMAEGVQADRTTCKQLWRSSKNARQSKKCLACQRSLLRWGSPCQQGKPQRMHHCKSSKRLAASGRAEAWRRRRWGKSEDLSPKNTDSGFKATPAPRKKLILSHATSVWSRKDSSDEEDLECSWLKPWAHTSSSQSKKLLWPKKACKSWRWLLQAGM